MTANHASSRLRAEVGFKLLSCTQPSISPCNSLCWPPLHEPASSSRHRTARTFFQIRLPYFILGIINSDSQVLPWRVAAVRFATGQPSSALPDTDGRHDRTGHGTWVLLAVFVAHDCRPWLSVTGTSAAGFGLCARNGSGSL